MVRLIPCLLLLLFSCRPKDTVPVEKRILSFSLKDIPVSGITIDESTGTIRGTVPYGTSLRSVLPEISLSPQVTVVPSVTVARDFSGPVTYTLTGSDGSRRVYTIVITTEEQPVPVIASFSPTSLRAGDTLRVSGRQFGTYALGLKAFLSGNPETEITCRVLDSTRASLIVPLSLKPGKYTFRLVRNGKSSVPSSPLTVRIPVPVLTTLRRYNVLPGDSLIAATLFTDFDTFRYAFRLTGPQHYEWPATGQAGKAVTRLPANTAPGIYSVSIANLSEQTEGMPAAQSIRIYDASLPFADNPQPVRAKAAATITLSVRNAQAVQARFYTVRLTSQTHAYSCNAVLSADLRTMTFRLPDAVAADSYQIRVVFVSDDGQERYTVDLDDYLTLE